MNEEKFINELLADEAKELLLREEKKKSEFYLKVEKLLYPSKRNKNVNKQK